LLSIVMASEGRRRPKAKLKSSVTAIAFFMVFTATISPSTRVPEYELTLRTENRELFEQKTI